jgi:hypothetical protein
MTLERIDELKAALEAVDNEFKAGRKYTADFLQMTPEEMDAYRAWQIDISDRIDAIRNALRETNKA